MGAKGGVFVSGEVLDVDFKQGNQGTDKAYAFHIVSVLTGKSVTEVKWDSRNISDKVPSEGDSVNLGVEFSTWAGRLQCNALRSLPPLGAVKTA